MLVDNGAGTGPVVSGLLGEALGAEVELVSMPHNIGPTRGRNAAFERVGATYAAAFDADGELEAGTLLPLVEALDGNPDAALASARVVEPGDDSSADGTRELEWGPAGATVYRREALDALNGFDPLFAWACEDLDFGHRARAGGWRCLEVGASRFAHPAEGRLTIRRARIFTEYLLTWRHVHYARVVVAKEWMRQVPALVRANPDARARALVGGTLGLFAYLRHIPAAEARRS